MTYLLSFIFAVDLPICRLIGISTNSHAGSKMEICFFVVLSTNAFPDIRALAAKNAGAGDSDLMYDIFHRRDLIPALECEMLISPRCSRLYDLSFCCFIAMFIYGFDSLSFC